jgi:hypothetical protein
VPVQASELIDQALHEYEDYDGDLDDVQPAKKMPGFAGQGRQVD